MILPPPGTYSYDISVSGKPVGATDVTISRNATQTTIYERGTVEGQSIASVAVYSNDGLRLQTFDLSVGGATVLRAVERSNAVDFNAGAMHFDTSASPRAFVDDGLAEALVLLPAAASQSTTGISLVTTMYPRVVPLTVQRDASTLTLRGEGVTETLKYDAGSDVMQEFDGARGMMMRLVRTTGAVQAAPSLAPLPATPEPFVSRFRSRQVTFVSKDGSRLAGTLSYPDGAGPFPAIMLIQGSGVSDRDETVGPNRIFAELADGLNARGYAVLRYDKRGTGGSTSSVPISRVVRQNAVDDGVAAVGFLRTAANIDAARLYALGHSEGGEIVMGVALSGAPVRGVIMLAPLPMNYTAMLERQIARTHVSGAVAAQLRAFEHQPYIASFNAVDPVAEVRAVRVPMLLIHGSNDMHVTGDDLRAFVAAATAAHPRSFTDVEIPGDTHLFARLDADAAAAAIDESTRIELDPRLIDALDAWLRSH